MRLCLLAVTALSLFATACDDVVEPVEEHGSPAEEAIEHGCIHVTDGPAVAITAAGDAASSPAAWTEHHRMDVRLTDAGDGTYHGYVHIDADAAGEVVVMVVESATVALTSGGTAVVAEETLADHAECTDVKTNYVFDVEVGRYDLYISGAATSTVSYVIAEVEGEHAH